MELQEKFSNFGYNIENDFHCNDQMLIIGIVSAKGIRKNVPVLQVGRHALAPPTPPVFRVVLFHRKGAGKNTCPDCVTAVQNIKKKHFDMKSHFFYENTQICTL